MNIMVKNYNPLFKKLVAPLLVALAVTSCSSPRSDVPGGMSLKDAFAGKFLMGAALNTGQVDGSDSVASAIVARHFNSIVAEDDMKCEKIHPSEDRYFWDNADRFVEFGEKHGMNIVGHCLVWHSQCAPWFFVDSVGNQIDAETLKARMRDHIHTVVGRYKGRVHGWDVVNEAIVEDGSFRQSKFYEILGEDFIRLAFRYAHEADPEAELYINDYGMNVPGRRDAYVRLVNGMKAEGLRVDAIGMQGHMGIDYPDFGQFEKAIIAFASTGCNVMITELDMSALPTLHEGANISDTVAFDSSMNPYVEDLPDDVEALWNKRMAGVFDILVRNSDVITRVNAWGVNDGDSWKNNWPVFGRTDYPLLLDREYNVKPFLREYTQPRKAIFSRFGYRPLGVDGLEAVDDVVNPLLPGCYPDPSIVRVGEDYYLVNSSFSFFPGVPIWHSTDLKNWNRLGFVLNRQSQLSLPGGISIRNGVYAPDISYNQANGKFYMITTLVGNGGTFYVTTDDPKRGEWSDPVWLPEVGGIDPSILFDVDSKAYIVNNDAPAGKPRYDGHRAIYAHEFDWANDRVTGNPVCILDGGIRPEDNPIWIEGPHLYHIGDKYYLMCAEGGTGPDHREVVLEGTSPRGKFTPCAINPILKAPSDDRFPVTCTGHADLVETPGGEWYAVFLAMRPYNADGHDICGRETFILPVDWSAGQPVVVGGDSPIPYRGGSGETVALWDDDGLAGDAFFIRNQQADRYQVDSGRLMLTASYSGFTDMCAPTAVGRWITENAFEVSTVIDAFDAVDNDDFAGIVIFKDDDANILFGRSVTADGRQCVRLSACTRGGEPMAREYEIADGGKPMTLVVRNNGDGMYGFAYGTDDTSLVELEDVIPADLLSSRTVDNFTGTMVGLCAVAR